MCIRDSHSTAITKDEQKKPRKSRGRPKWRYCWTRIFSVEPDTALPVLTYLIEEEAESLAELPPAPVTKSNKPTMPLFCSHGFFEAQETPRFEDFALKDRHLKLQGRQVTLARQNIIEQAGEVDEVDMLEVALLGKKIRLRGS